MSNTWETTVSRNHSKLLNNIFVWCKRIRTWSWWWANSSITICDHPFPLLFYSNETTVYIASLTTLFWKTFWLGHVWQYRESFGIPYKNEVSQFSFTTTTFSVLLKFCNKCSWVQSLTCTRRLRCLITNTSPTGQWIKVASPEESNLSQLAIDLWDEKIPLPLTFNLSATPIYHKLSG